MHLLFFSIWIRAVIKTSLVMLLSSLLIVLLFFLLMFISFVLSSIFSYWITAVLTSLLTIGSIKLVSFASYHIPYKLFRLRSSIVGVGVSFILLILFLFNILNYTTVNTFQLPNNTFILVNLFFIIGLLDGLRLMRIHWYYQKKLLPGEDRVGD